LVLEKVAVNLNNIHARPRKDKHGPVFFYIGHKIAFKFNSKVNDAVIMKVD
jgi:prephenate dehydratase